MIDKQKFEQRIAGASSYLDPEQVTIVWGGDPMTNGTQIQLPDELREPWDSKSIIRGAYNHEVAHIMFESDIEGMSRWVRTWSNDGTKFSWHDPYGLIEEVAEGIIQTTEDQRIESLFGEIRPGAARRWREDMHPRLARLNDPSQDPGTAYLLMRFSKRWIDSEPTSPHNHWAEIAEEWDSELAQFFYDQLDRIEGAEMDMTFLVAEQVMEEILPWYRERLQFAETDHIGQIQGELEDKTDEKRELERQQEKLKQIKIDLEEQEREAEAAGNWEEADEIQDQLDEIEEELRDTSRETDELDREIEDLERNIEQTASEQEQTTEQIQEIIDDSQEIRGQISREDYEPPEESIDADQDVDIDSDLEERLESAADRRISEIRDQAVGQLPDIDAAEAVSPSVREIPPTETKKGRVYHGIVDEIVEMFSRIYGRRSTRLSQSGSEVDVDEFIGAMLNDSGDTEIMIEESSDLGFNVIVLLDLSMSMIGKKLNVCRNVGSTLHESIDRLSDRGIPIDFSLYGYGGSKHDDTLMIRPATTPEETRRISHHPDFAKTPTWAAIEYGRERVRRQEGETLMLLITDGRPTGLDAAGNRIPQGRALSYTQRELDRCQGIHLFTLGIGVSLPDSEMRRIYGNYENVHDESQAAQIFLRYVRSEIMQHLMTI